MKPISIDLRNSDKGERKKAVKYLRGKGISVYKKRSTKCGGYYLSNNHPMKCNYDFSYYGGCRRVETILTLPRDWDKFVEIVEEEKEEFEVGVWYKNESAFCKYVGNGKGIGVGNCGRWTDHMNMIGIEDWKPTTHEEIQKHLTEEAKRRGYGKGVKYLKNGNEYEFGNINTLEYYEIKDYLTDGWGGSIYSKGQWAEIIKDEVPVIGGYRLDEYNGKFKIGYHEFTNHDINTIKHVMESREIEAIQIKGQLVTIDEVRKVVEYIKNK